MRVDATIAGTFARPIRWPGLRWTMLCLGALLVVLLPVRALAEERLIKREVLALFDSREGPLQDTHMHKLAEMPLNHLGYSAIFWDIERGLPDIRSVERYRAVITWFNQPVSKPDAFLQWASEVVDRGLKLVILGHIGAPIEPRYLDAINGVLGDIGLKHSGQFVQVPFAAHALVKDPAIMEFERKLDPVIPGFALITADARDVVPHLTLASARGPRAQSSVLVATSPRGGFVTEDMAVVYEGSRDRISWLINPFTFLMRALGSEVMPIPDVTTLDGLRIYFSHIDGDGWNNVSQIERFARTGTLSSEVVSKELIEPYPDLPVTVGLIAGDVDPELGGDPAGRPIARKLFALPQVEVASHTHTHPYAWQYFERYDRNDEIRLIDSQERVERRLYDRAIGGIMKLAKKEQPRQIHQRYIAGSAEMPRSYMRRPYELDLEVEGALRAAEQLAPTGKRALLYQWSGDTTPYEAAIRATREAGVRNINGGDSRYDLEYPSIAYVPPIGKSVGAERQIYAVNSNENTYTNDWTGPFYACRRLEETVRNTDTGGRRLQAFNLYYHMYSGEKPAALEAVRQHLNAARFGAYIPIAASHYAAIADSFYDVEIRQLGPNRWRVNRRGDLQTVRFDDAAALTVDLAASVGVLGEKRHGSVLYLALDSEVEDAIVALRPVASQTSSAPATIAPASTPPATTAPAPAAATVDPAPASTSEAGGDTTPPPSALPSGAQPAVADVGRSGADIQLIESRWRISDLTRGECGFTAVAEGYGAGQMAWRGIAPGRYELSAKRADKIMWRQELVVDETRGMAITIHTDALNPLAIELSCVRAN